MTVSLALNGHCPVHLLCHVTSNVADDKAGDICELSSPRSRDPTYIIEHPLMVGSRGDGVNIITVSISPIIVELDEGHNGTNGQVLVTIFCCWFPLLNAFTLQCACIYFSNPHLHYYISFLL